jgi:squalene-hopene/tetraprenyl-beta-curcumene cyclase
MAVRAQDSAVTSATRRARANLLARQLPNGSFRSCNIGGPIYVSMLVVVESLLGSLADQEREDALDSLLRQQASSGGFAAFWLAGSDHLEVDATACAYAAMLVCGLPASDQRARSAREYCEARGGLENTRLETRLFLVMAGALPVTALPPMLPLCGAVPGLDRAICRVSKGYVAIGAHLLPLVVQAVRAVSPGEILKRSARPPTRATRRSLEFLLNRVQGEAGGIYSVLFYSLLCRVVFRHFGVPDEAPPARRLRGFVERLKGTNGDGFRVGATASEVWDTAFASSALQCCPGNGADAGIASAARYLLEQQVSNEVSAFWQNPRPGDVRSGGWAFSEGTALADPDATAVVARALQGSRRRSRQAGDIERSLDRAGKWLAAMQHPDGGWPSFTRSSCLRLSGWFRRRSPKLAELLECSVEDVSSRVLMTGGLLPESSRLAAQRFLLSTQLPQGCWANSWLVNYLIGTAYAVRGLGTTGAGNGIVLEHLARARHWICLRQNSDGGWGESVSSYRDPRQAGIGPSSPTQTAHMILALISGGHESLAGSERCRAHAARGIAYLVDTQAADGAFMDTAVQSVLIPSLNLFYCSDLVPQYSALQALAAYGSASVV